MDEISCKLTVFFEEPFWVGIFEHAENGGLTAAKVTFGAQPRDCEVYEFILRHFYELRFSPAVADAHKETDRNPKRMQREAKRQMLSAGAGTRSQQALSLQREKLKQERKSVSRERRQEQERLRFEQKQQKKKEKHRGR